MKLVEEKWKMYFDGATNRRGCGIGILLISPEESHNPLAIKLNFLATNNIAEYEACILELEVAHKLGIEDLEVYSDSTLIICQIQGKWKIKEEKLQPYHEYLTELFKRFKSIEFHYLPRAKNLFADALATLALMIDIPEDVAV